MPSVRYVETPLKCSTIVSYLIQGTVANHPAGFPTVSSHVASESVLNPLISLLRNDDEDVTSEKTYRPSSFVEFRIDYSMPVLRAGVQMRGRSYVGMVLHRTQLDTCFGDESLLGKLQTGNDGVSTRDVNFRKYVQPILGLPGVHTLLRFEFLVIWSEGRKFSFQF